jgi:hypothetical protein
LVSKYPSFAESGGSVIGGCDNSSQYPVCARILKAYSSDLFATTFDCTTANRTPFQAGYPEKTNKQIFVVIGLDDSFTFQNLRHTAVTIMLNNGM